MEKRPLCVFELPWGEGQGQRTLFILGVLEIPWWASYWWYWSFFAMYHGWCGTSEYTPCPEKTAT